ncbi:MAG TPA: helix-turn-helix domain-containing protein [Spirochaetota bacterium]|nr:helix-turn-helix domain-containing protein [Spirochaetota bacterium]
MKSSFLNKIIKVTRQYKKESGIDSIVIDKEGRILYGNHKKWYCRHFYCAHKKKCRQEHLLTLRELQKWAGRYFHLCHQELVLWGMPLLVNEQLCGGVISGFVYFNTFRRENLNPAVNFPGAKQPCYLSNSNINYYARLLLSMFKNNPAFNTGFLQKMQQKVDLQQEIAEKIISGKNYEDHSGKQEQVYQEQQKLIYSIKYLEVADIRENLNNLLSSIYLEGMNDLALLKFRMLELFVIIARTMIEAGSRTTDYYNLMTEYIRNTENMNDLFSFSAWLKEKLNHFIARVIKNRQKQSFMKKVREYIEQHLNRNVPLKEAAAVANFSVSRFSYLFKQDTGHSFRDYVLRRKIAKARELLNSGLYDISDVALALNFYDQSYFTKVFKRFTGYTPRAYYRRHSNRKEL